MKPRQLFRSSFPRAMAAIALLVAAGCRASERQVGSACANGVCPQTEQQGLTCTLSSLPMEVRDLAGFVCVNSGLVHEANGQVDCELYWYDSPPGRLGPAGTCEAHAFLESGDGGTGTECRIRQLPAGAAGPTADNGWFAEREPASDRCRAGQTSVGFRLPFVTGELPDPAVVIAYCTEALTRTGAGDVAGVNPSECAGPGSGSRGVGEECLPAAIPERGFDDRSVYLETGSQQCETGTCIVYRLAGDPRKDCQPLPPNEVAGDPGKTCPDAAAIENSIYCTCRCDAPPGSDAPECDCPDGFSCVDADTAPESLRGSYCVRNGTFPQ